MSLLFYFLGILILSLIFFLFIFPKYYFRWTRHLPSPGRHFLFGSLKLIPIYDTEKRFRYLLNFVEKVNTKIACIWIGPFNPTVLIAHPDAAKIILRSSINIAKSDFYDLMYPWLGHGLVTVPYAKWKRKRNLLTPAFHFDILQSYFPIYVKHIRVFCQKLLQASKEDKSVDLTRLTLLCSLDIINECAFGVEVNAQNQSNSDYVNSVQTLAHLFTRRFFSPLKKIDFFYQFTQEGKEWSRALKIVKELPRAVIQQRRKQLASIDEKNNQKESNDLERVRSMNFLELLLKTRDDTGQELTVSEIEDEVHTFMFAGHDTTTNALSWTVYLVSSHPEVEEKLLNELDQVLGKVDKSNQDEDGLSTSLDPEKLSSLKYLTMVVKESMRLFPPVPGVARKLITDVEIDGHVLPAGISVGINQFVIHHSNRCWTDPERFDPERFDTEKEIKDKDPFNYIPFSAGPRNCIGQHFAMHEVKTVLALLYRNFRLEVDKSHPVQMEQAIVLRPKNGIKVFVKKRV
eukprot:TRINITY_DN2808_c0_g1_i1.p1 TRINITY_DN2808_c0_g1~~TRINITY_DN2808_c0_g1_i1.p1  ORF type:complete len:516 (-),score=125.41 TRINITY_DN2808_c0_g1_i1:39-1586(-)